MENIDFWDRRKVNKDDGMPMADQEQFVEETDTPNVFKTETNGLLFDIKGQLVELNVTMATIGELFGKYLETLPSNIE